MSDETDKAILEAARRVRAATTDGDRQAAQYALTMAIDAETQPPTHAFKAGDWVEYEGRGHCVADVHGSSVGLVGVAKWIAASACLPIPPRPEPRDGWEPDGCIITEPCDMWFTAKEGFPIHGCYPIITHPLYGSRRWRAVRSKVEAVPEAPKPAATPAMPTPEMIAAAIAHRACCGSEHDTSMGKFHGYCIVCGVPWPCRTAKAFLFNPGDPVGVREGGAS
jgi:hypothetical protein